jgi:hypothetical protein
MFNVLKFHSRKLESSLDIFVHGKMEIDYWAAEKKRSPMFLNWDGGGNDDPDNDS